MPFSLRNIKSSNSELQNTISPRTKSFTTTEPSFGFLNRTTWGRF